MCEKLLKMLACGFIAILCTGCKTPEKTLHKIACEGGDIDACFQLGKLQYESGEKITVKKKLIDSCTNGNFEGCMSLGALALGQGNRTEAKRFLRKACSGNVYVACYGLAELEYEAGNTTAAKKLFLRHATGDILMAAGTHRLNHLLAKRRSLNRGNLHSQRKNSRPTESPHDAQHI